MRIISYILIYNYTYIKMKEETVYDSKLKCELIIHIGANAKDNWNIIDMAKPNDIWFHVEDHPSAHVILIVPTELTQIKDVSKMTLKYCANLCKKNKENKDQMSVIYTQIKNVTKADKEGSVSTINCKVIY